MVWSLMMTMRRTKIKMKLLQATRLLSFCMQLSVSAAASASHRSSLLPIRSPCCLSYSQLQLLPRQRCESEGPRIPKRQTLIAELIATDVAVEGVQHGGGQGDEFHRLDHSASSGEVIPAYLVFEQPVIERTSAQCGLSRVLAAC